MNRDMLSRRLLKRGYEIVTAIDGEEGIDKARTENPDLILMDMSLPKIPGWEATRVLRQDAAVRQVPMIAPTAHAISGDRERAMDCGCNDYDTQPIDLSRLIGKMELLLGG
jgi:CheY-like chemotaxis protein